MKNKDEIYKEVEKTMHALDGAERAATDDYFFSRLESRIENRNSESVEGVLSWSFAAVLIVILINIATLYYYAEKEFSNTDAESEEITAMAEEYSLTIPSVYEYEQEISE